jgi:hypothetical protein
VGGVAAGSAAVSTVDWTSSVTPGSVWVWAEAKPSGSTSAAAEAIVVKSIFFGVITHSPS